MGTTKEQRIRSAINFLETNGYKVSKNYSVLIGKWVAFRRDGMKPILHGKVIDVNMNGFCFVKCKNSDTKWVHINNVIEFTDDKKLCYEIQYPEFRKEI